MRFMKFRIAAAAAALACAIAAPIQTASAQTVDAIKKGGVLKIGSQVAQVPWGFSDSSNKLTGFDIELGEMLAKDLGVKLEVTPVTSSNRVAALLTGQVDVLAAVMGIFADRQKVVLFSRPYTTNDTIYIGKTSANIKGWNELNGVRVGVPRGTPQDIAITKAAPAGAIIQRFDDDAGTVQALIAGQVDMIGGAATQVPNIAQVVGPGKYEEKFIVARAYNAFAVRPQSREWATYLSEFVARKLASGELPALYKKWIGGELGKMPDTGEGEGALPVSMVQ
ncbi:transporter substrate-binding domain-containing protein [Terrarubrum flagellatum]|uniref:transporter substrate-binding domain-containing protein n=1 Tax=Terrirubrum flagellatum TaxID=2895980 RepID=UPI0031450B28